MVASAEIGSSLLRMPATVGDLAGLDSYRHISRALPVNGVRSRSLSCERGVMVVRSESTMGRTDRVGSVVVNGSANLGPEVRSGDVPQPILLVEGQEFNFTIKRGVSVENTVSVNYDDFINDVDIGDVLLVDGGMMSLSVKEKTHDTVKCEVIDGGELKSRRHLNVRGKSATLPSITEKDWEDIKFGVDNQIDFYALSFVKDAEVVYELKDYLKRHNSDIHVIVKIESADSIPNLPSIICF
ncbi:hypothetical protein HPP92_028030 [Vanilla planifolia]|uniref:Pyruvate kinase n=1 Tax=Vanilla planifolia TaxID=51239 RepID=A0A835U427_VANPL|nr:hypothetical protein HPP92_028030 [Vanilla planifolia]KAG0448096.1 hypothetical protein HPP92_027997 [Vanilla planifolia]